MGFTARFSRNKKISPYNEDPSPSVSPPINSPATRKELKEVFDKFDTNGDEKISEWELNSALSSVGHSVKAGELKKMFSKADSDKGGLINFEEFASCYRVLEHIRDSFSLFDRDKDGFVTAEELENRFINSLGEEISIEECRNMIGAADTNGDKMMSYEEFRVLMVGSKFRD